MEFRYSYANNGYLGFAWLPQKNGTVAIVSDLFYETLERDANLSTKLISGINSPTAGQRVLVQFVSFSTGIYERASIYASPDGGLSYQFVGYATTTAPNWSSLAFDVTPFVTGSVNPRLRFRSSDENLQGSGWAIDDVNVTVVIDPTQTVRQPYCEAFNLDNVYVLPNGWTNDLTDNGFDWVLGSASVNIPSGNGSFIYGSDRSDQAGEVYLISPWYNTSVLTIPTLSFSLYNFPSAPGPNTASLSVDVWNSATSVWSSVGRFNDTSASAEWAPVSVSFPTMATARFRFRYSEVARFGGNDIGIDNVCVKQGVAPVVPSTSQCPTLSLPSGGVAPYSWFGWTATGVNVRVSLGSSAAAYGSIFNYTDMTTAHQYQPTQPLQSGTTYYVKFWPYTSAGVQTGCPVVSFSTIGVINTFPYSQGFDTDNSSFVDWSNGVNTENWALVESTLYSTAAPFSAPNMVALIATAPSTESSIISPVFDTTSISSRVTLEFYYYISYAEASTAVLFVDVFSTGSWIQVASFGSGFEDAWLYASVDLTSRSSSTLVIRLRGRVSSTAPVDIAVDSITLSNNIPVTVTTGLTGLIYTAAPFTTGVLVEVTTSAANPVQSSSGGGGLSAGGVAGIIIVVGLVLLAAIAGFAYYILRKNKAIIADPSVPLTEVKTDDQAAREQGYRSFNGQGNSGGSRSPGSDQPLYASTPTATAPDRGGSAGTYSASPPEPTKAPKMSESAASKAFAIDFTELEDLKQIGQGSFGIVYKGKWRETTVAVKRILLANDSLDAKAISDFETEAKLLKQLRPHPNVVLFLGITLSPQPVTIVTEFCEGGSLYNMIHSGAKFDLALQYRILRGIARGLLHLHSEGLIHRDLASRNILLTANNDVKVTDFGMSRQKHETSNANKTYSGVGPLKWWPPEAIRDRTYSEKADVWSYAVTAWELLAKSEPYPNVDITEVAMKVVYEGLRLDIPADTDPAIANILRACWQTDPDKRPTMKEICSALAGPGTPP